MTFNSVTLARTIWLPDDGPRTETCRSVFNVLMCKFYKFYICAVVGKIIEWHSMTFAQRRNRIMTQTSVHVPVVKRGISVLPLGGGWESERKGETNLKYLYCLWRGGGEGGGRERERKGVTNLKYLYCHWGERERERKGENNLKSAWLHPAFV